MARVVLLLLAVCVVAHAFYLPGVSPIEFKSGDKALMRVNKLTSTKTQLPYDYYSLPFCKPKEVVSTAENLGEVLRGDRLESSLYEIIVGETEYCKVLCRQPLTDEQVEIFQEKVKDDYRVHWELDNLPAAMRRMVDEEEGEKLVYEDGFPLGFVGTGQRLGEEKDVPYLVNHVRFKILYHNDPSFEGSRLVGFEVKPYSIHHQWLDGKDAAEEPKQPDTCNKKPEELAHEALAKGMKETTFTYDVTWEESDVKWASRWDAYLYMTDDDIHWFSIINSVMVVLFLTGMVAMIMMRTLHKDFARYNQLETSEEIQEDTGWKLVHGDVFRPPKRPMLLSVMVGSGVQIFAMSVLTMIFAVLGFLSPAHRGGLMTVMLLAFVLMGYFAGYIMSRVFKMFKGVAWKTSTLITAFGFPGVVFLIFFIVNLAVWAMGSSAAVPFLTLLALMAMWFGVSVPLTFLGSYVGFSATEIAAPVRTNQIPRQIPDQVWYMRAPYSVIMGGVLPFGAVFIEVFFILSSIWLHKFYYIFGFLFLVLLILGITCAEITVVMCYFQLCSEDYRWWWRAFLTAGTSALHMFIYSVLYFFTKLEISGFVSGLLFYGYTLIMCLCFFLLTGTVGFWSCFWFVRKIYSSVKTD